MQELQSELPAERRERDSWFAECIGTSCRGTSIMNELGNRFMIFAIQKPAIAVHADNTFPRRGRLQSVEAGLLAFGSS